METLKFLFDAIVWLVIGFYIGRTFGKKHNLDFARVIAILPDSVVKTLRKAGCKLRAGQFSNLHQSVVFVNTDVYHLPAEFIHQNRVDNSNG